MAIDPVCGMRVKRDEAATHRMYKGRTYYFCVPWCAELFDADPEKFHLASMTKKEIDPVCGMTVKKTDKAAIRKMYKDRMYYFCAPGCRDAFATDPEKYLSRATAPPKNQGVRAKLFKKKTGPE